MPEMSFAADGYVGVALMRRNNIDIDLHDVELGNAAHLLEGGATLEQALSARWGGAYAIEADLGYFEAGIEAYLETAEEEGLSEACTRTKFRAGALGALTLALHGLCCIIPEGHKALFSWGYYTTQTVFGVPIAEKRLSIAARSLISVI